jgi:hypothetical protein
MWVIQQQTRVGVRFKGESRQRWLTSACRDIRHLGGTHVNKLKSQYQQLIGQFPGIDAKPKQLLKVIRNIEEMARYTPALVGESEQWSSIVSTAKENRQNFYKVLNRENLFSALYGTFTVTLYELKAMLKASTPGSQSKTPKSAASLEDGFKEVRGRERNSTNETAPTSRKAACTAVDTPHTEVATQNIFAPQRASNMDTDSSNTEVTPREAAAPAKPRRPRPIVLISAVKLILLQKQLKMC